MDPWTPEAYMKVLYTDLSDLHTAINDVDARIFKGRDASWAASEVVRFAAKIQDNAVLLRQRLNADEANRSRPTQ